MLLILIQRITGINSVLVSIDDILLMITELTYQLPFMSKFVLYFVNNSGKICLINCSVPIHTTVQNDKNE